MHRLLFSAPVDFDGTTWNEYEMAFDDVLAAPFSMMDANNHHYWYRDCWVCDPKENFVISDMHLATIPDLKILATPSTGNNHIDLDAVKRRGIKFISLLDDRPGLETISASAEFTFKLLLDALRMSPARELHGKNIGLIGFGRIGRRLARWIEAFGANYTAVDPKEFPHLDSTLLMRGMFCSFDAIVICCSLTPETRGMIGFDLLSAMKHGAALVNTARGEVIDEDALVRVMEERPDLRVAVDVVCGEVTGTAKRWRIEDANENAIVTPHIAGETFDSRTKAARIILNLLKRELAQETPQAWASPAQVELQEI